MRADERWRNVPCIMLTAAGQEQQHKQAMELGANEFLTKPFSPKKLYARAAELIGVAAEEMGVPRALSRWAVDTRRRRRVAILAPQHAERPKQLLPLVTDSPLLADTVARLAPLVPAERTLVVTKRRWRGDRARCCRSCPPRT